MSLSADNMIFYIEKPKHSSKKLLQLKKKFSKGSEDKINIQKLVAFVHTNNKLSEKKKKTIPLRIALQITK